MLLTGDIHRSSLKITTFIKEYGNNYDKKDVMIVLGDAGIIWYGNKKDDQFIKILSNLNITICFIDGNHENFKSLNKIKKSKWKGGKVHKISDNIYHLIRGEIYEIENKKVFAFGGAMSVDRGYGKTEKEWWKEEIPNEDEIRKAYKNLSNYNNEVDIVLTHAGPSNIVYGDLGFKKYLNDPVPDLLQEINKKIKFKNWYFGHYHLDKCINNYRCMYNDIIEL